MGRNSQRFQTQQVVVQDDYPMEDVNLLKQFLDEGTLNVKSRYRNFTTFLDFKHEFHNEFLSKVWEYVDRKAFVWKDLLERESLRKGCALGFLKENGKTYWGSEANRQKYLMPNSLLDPISLFVYPERKEELARALMILLEKKAISKVKDSRKSTGMLADDLRHSPTPSAFTFNESRGRKREPSEEADAPNKKVQIKRGSSRPLPRSKSMGPERIRPFNSILIDDDTHPSSSMKKKKADKIYDDVVILDHPATRDTNDLTDSSSTEDLQISDISYTQNLYSKQQEQTKFLVTASTQTGMAPVWVPFQYFGTAASFLSRMEQESGVREWNPSAQLNNGIWSSGAMSVMAASVKFEWTGFFIRVRSGCDQDWKFVMDEIHKAWCKDQVAAAEDEPAGFRFRISVMLHVVA